VSSAWSDSLIASGLRARMSQAFEAHRTFFLNAGHLAFGTGSAAALGFVYWWFAARSFPPSAVGYAAGAISLMNFIGHLGEFGLGALMIGAAHRFRDRTGPFISAAIAVASACSALFAIGCLAMTFALPLQLGGIVGDGGGLALVLGCAFTGFTLVLDQALVGLLRARLQAVRNLVFAAVKLALLVGAPVMFAASALKEQVILTTWVVGQGVSILLLLSLDLSRINRVSLRPDFSLLRPLVPELLAHHCLNLANLAPSLLLPFLVTICLTPSTNAAFYAAWTIVNVAFLIPASLATVVFAVGSHDTTKLTTKLRASMLSSLAAAAVVALVCFAGARLILAAFSPIYAEIGTRSLQILGFSMVPVSIKYHYVSVQRIRGRMASASLLQAFGGALELVGAVAGARFGDLTGFTTGWLLGLCIEAALMFPVVLAALSSRRPLKANTARASRLAEVVGPS
jgi:O-antigen/teichoic acid export membrane protein